MATPQSVKAKTFNYRSTAPGNVDAAQALGIFPARRGPAVLIAIALAAVVLAAFFAATLARWARR
jgi:hypothetical protein